MRSLCQTSQILLFLEPNMRAIKKMLVLVPSHDIFHFRISGMEVESDPVSQPKETTHLPWVEK